MFKWFLVLKRCEDIFFFANIVFTLHCSPEFQNSIAIARYCDRITNRELHTDRYLVLF